MKPSSNWDTMATMAASLEDTRQPRASVREVLWAFLRLGCTSFGGPIAHLGYFRREFVQQRRWCGEETFAELIAIAQSLPGPASSQVGFALGLLRAGWLGGVAAWVGFTAPSVLLMLAFAYGYGSLGPGVGFRALHGLQIAAVAAVAQAVLGMYRSLAADRPRTALVVISAGLSLFLAGPLSTGAPIVLGALAGWWVLKVDDAGSATKTQRLLSKRAGALCGVVFVALLAVALVAQRNCVPSAWPVFAAFYRSGALVFGGGHVVLPLLESAVVGPGWVTHASFLAGYGAVQAVPGPLFTFAAYLGACVRPVPSPIAYGVLGLVGVFLPGLLAMAAVLPFWNVLCRMPRVQAALMGVNASVVGILAAALYRPLWTTAILCPSDFWIALAAFALLARWKLQPWMVVAATTIVAAIAG
jgi:chromate transporter